MTIIAQWTGLDAGAVTASAWKYLTPNFDNGDGLYFRNVDGNAVGRPSPFLKIQYNITSDFAPQDTIIIFGLAQAGNNGFSNNLFTFSQVPVDLEYGLEAGVSWIVPFPSFIGRQYIRPAFTASKNIADVDGRWDVRIINELV